MKKSYRVLSIDQLSELGRVEERMNELINEIMLYAA